VCGSSRPTAGGVARCPAVRGVVVAVGSRPGPPDHRRRRSL